MPTSIGQRLKREREARRLTLEKAAEATRLRIHYLQALENDDYSVMSSAAQGRGFLRNYADFLGVDLDEAMEEVRRADSPPAAPEAAPEPIPAPEPSASTPAPKAGRGGFWSRLLRRPSAAPETEAPAAESVPATETATPAPEPPLILEPARPVMEEVPASEEAAPRKSASKKTASKASRAKSADVSKPRAASKKKTVVESKPETLTPEPVIVEPTPEPGFPPEPKTEELTDEFHPQWWERLRASLGIGVSEPRPPEVTEEAAGEAVAPPPEEIPPRPVSGRSSDAIFAGIGAELRSRRVALNLTREEIERHLRVRASYLKALEDGDFEALPSAVQTRGMLSNYAAFLDLDAEALLLRFADVLQARHRERHPVPPGARGVDSPNPSRSLPALRSFLAADVWGVALVILLVVFLVWGVGRVVQASRVKAEPTARSISEVLLEATEIATLPVEATTGLLDLDITSTPAAPATPFLTPTLPEGVNVQLNIVALERTFLRVTVDGKVAFDGRVTPGTAYPFEGQERIEILSGSAAAIQVTYNGRQMGILGNPGAVVNLIYTAEGVLTPTATLIPTPTITLTPTITPSITATMVPSRTPTPP